LVLGGAGKMAGSFSRTFLSAGCNSLTITDVNGKRLKECAKQLAMEFPGAEIGSFVCDVASKSRIDNLYRFLKKETQHIDVVVYTVMSKPEGYYAPFSGYSRTAWDKVISGNLSGAFFVTQKLLPILNNSASLIFIGSIYGIVSPDFRIYERVKSNIYSSKYPLTLPASYTVSKAGLIGLTKYLAVYLADKDIRVNTLVAGGVYDGQDKKFCAEYAKRVPLKRMASWDDYDGALLFLASEASKYMTGQSLIVDGGWSAW